MASQMLGVRLAEREEAEVQRLVEEGYFISASELIREAVREKLQSIRIVAIRKADYKQARKEILGWLKKNKEGFPSQISSDLNLDWDLVTRIMRDLEKEGVVG
ncbi:MAG: hypothetical protein HYW25_03375 [Candidatus Aenigmarchaeota archaeon]|nr:hypothetical protein [Candidatus Aenigmarchaeota archaeon]